MQDTENNEPNEDIVEDELDIVEDSEAESQDDLSQHDPEEDEQDIPESPPKSGLTEKEKQVESLANKVFSGEKTLEDIENNPVLKAWAYDLVKARVDEKIEEHNKDAKLQTLEKKYKELEEKIGKQEAQKEKDRAKQLIKEFRESQGLTVKEFQEYYPNFQSEYTELVGKVGMKKAVELSLNTIIAQGSRETNPNLRAKMKLPSGGIGSRPRSTKTPRSTMELGQALGLTDEDFKNFKK